jgi:hypothetical protein
LKEWWFLTKNKSKFKLTEVSDVLEGLRDLTEGELSEVVHNGLLGELEVGSRGSDSTQG